MLIASMTEVAAFARQHCTPQLKPIEEGLYARNTTEIRNQFVADMDKAVKFYRDMLGLKVKFESSARLCPCPTIRQHARASREPCAF